MSDIGCPDFFEAPFSVIRQKDTARRRDRFIHAYGRIGLITVSIGGNDLGDTTDNVPAIAANIDIIATKLRAAAGDQFRSSVSPAPTSSWLNGSPGRAA